MSEIVLAKKLNVVADIKTSGNEYNIMFMCFTGTKLPTKAITADTPPQHMISHVIEANTFEKPDHARCSICGHEYILDWHEEGLTVYDA